jgi:hypothetical protein
MDDRCDRCGQRAYTWWWRAEDKCELTFCAHCTTLQQDALRFARFLLARDTRSELTARPVPA